MDNKKSKMSTQQKILEATERIIQAKGIAHATTKEIARESGFAEGTLYKHFECKEDLFLMVLERNLPSFVAALGEYVAGDGTVQANLEHQAGAAIKYYEQLIPLAAAFFSDRELLASHRKVMDQIDGGPQRIYERIARYVEEEQQLGRIDGRQEPLRIAALLLGPCFQYVFLRQFMGTNPLPQTEEQFVTGLVQTLIVGISPVST